MSAPGVLAIRTVAGAFSLSCYYGAIMGGAAPGDHGALATANLLLKTAPVWVALGAGFVLGERPTTRTWIALAVGVAGATIALLGRVEASVGRSSIVLGTLSGVFAACAYLSVRRLAASEEPLTVVTFFSLGLAFVMAPIVIARGRPLPDRHGWLCLAGVAVFGTAAQLFMTMLTATARRRSSRSRVSPRSRSPSRRRSSSSESARRSRRSRAAGSPFSRGSSRRGRPGDNELMLPALFVSHGSPLIALDTAGPFAKALGAFGARHRPRAVVVVSAHWQTRTPSVTASPRLIDDFGGFPDELSEIAYDCSGDEPLAEAIAAKLGARVEDRGLDHGTWVPLRFLFPRADVPVVQVSLPRTSHEELRRLGAELASFDDVLLVGSGGVVHNLRLLHWDDVRAPVDEWAKEFDDWVWANLGPDLDHMKHRAANLAVPTSEHFDPLYVVLGAGARKGELVFEGFETGTSRCGVHDDPLGAGRRPINPAAFMVRTTSPFWFVTV